MNGIESLVIREILPQARPLVQAFFDQMGGESRAFVNRAGGNERRVMEYLEGKRPDEIHFMAQDEGRMVGLVFLYDAAALVPWLGIAVAEDYKGKHLGRRLIDRAHAQALAMGAGGVLLTTAVSNLRGQGLYERMGYERLGTHSSGEFLYIHRFPAK